MKTSHRQYLILSLALFALGILFYSWYNEIIIIRLPFKKVGTPVEQEQSQRKPSKLTFWNGESLVTEERELLASRNTIRTLHDLITSWLTIQDEEKLMAKKVSLQFILIDTSGKEASISFDRNPLLKEKSILEKLMWIEGLLRTVKDTGTKLQSIRFLVHGKALQDSHLDFSSAWPISGYLKK